MKKKIIAFLISFILTNVCLAQNQQSPAASSPAPTIPAAKIEKIDAAVSAWMAQHKAPALSVAIALDDRLKLSKAYGLAESKTTSRRAATRRFASQ